MTRLGYIDGYVLGDDPSAQVAGGYRVLGGVNGDSGLGGLAGVAWVGHGVLQVMVHSWAVGGG